MRLSAHDDATVSVGSRSRGKYTRHASLRVYTRVIDRAALLETFRASEKARRLAELRVKFWKFLHTDSNPVKREQQQVGGIHRETKLKD